MCCHDFRRIPTVGHGMVRLSAVPSFTVMVRPRKRVGAPAPWRGSSDQQAIEILLHDVDLSGLRWVPHLYDLL